MMASLASPTREGGFSVRQRRPPSYASGSPQPSSTHEGFSSRSAGGSSPFLHESMREEEAAGEDEEGDGSAFGPRIPTRMVSSPMPPRVQNSAVHGRASPVASDGGVASRLSEFDFVEDDVDMSGAADDAPVSDGNAGSAPSTPNGLTRGDATTPSHEDDGGFLDRRSFLSSKDTHANVIMSADSGSTAT
ncbi:hypothetical protein EON66_11110, partial [archaeon]